MGRCPLTARRPRSVASTLLPPRPSTSWAPPVLPWPSASRPSWRCCSSPCGWCVAAAGVAAPEADVDDRALVAEQLGRAPMGEFDVVVRDATGAPRVIRNAPFLADGTPMPTRYWLVDAAMCDAVARLEAPGGVDLTLAVLREYRATLDRLGVERVRMTATSAARDAANREIFFEPAAEIVGTAPELLSGDEEGRLAFTGATAELDPERGPF